jgi:hypothetical protein
MSSKMRDRRRAALRVIRAIKNNPRRAEVRPQRDRRYTAAQGACNAAVKALEALSKVFTDVWRWGGAFWVEDGPFSAARRHLLDAEYNLREAVAHLDTVLESPEEV